MNWEEESWIKMIVLRRIKRERWISFGVSSQKKRSRSSFRKKSQTIRKKETGPNLWIFESEECLEVLKQ